MSPAQAQLYWRAYAAAARAQGWASVDGIERARQARELGAVWVSPDLDQVLAAVWRIAGQLAADGGGNTDANALRHACHVVAIGHGVSSKKLSNADFDSVLTLFRLLADPNRLANVIAWETVCAEVAPLTAHQ